MQTLETFIAKLEGSIRLPYKCSAGKLTIGVGRNLQDNGLSPDEIRLLLSNDLRDAKAGAQRICPVFDQLNEPRQWALISMVFQMGRKGVSKFKNMLVAIEDQDFDRAADEMLDSRWARQTPRRAELQSKMMREGVH